MAIFQIFFNLTRIGEYGLSKGVRMYKWEEIQSFSFIMESSNENKYYPDGTCWLSLKDSTEAIKLHVNKDNYNELRKILEQNIKLNSD